MRVSHNLNYTSENELNSIQSELIEIREMIPGLVRYLSNKKIITLLVTYYSSPVT